MAEPWCCQCLRRVPLPPRKARGFHALENGAGAEPPLQGLLWVRGSPLGSALPFPMELTASGAQHQSPGGVWNCIQLLFRNPPWPGAASSSQNWWLNTHPSPLIQWEVIIFQGMSRWDCCPLLGVVFRSLMLLLLLALSLLISNGVFYKSFGYSFLLLDQCSGNADALWSFIGVFQVFVQFLQLNILCVLLCCFLLWFILPCRQGLH